MITVMLLPGLDGTGALFAPFVAALGSGVHVTVVPYPVAEALGYAELESIVRAALPTIGPYVILAESFSGPIAISLAASASGQLRGLILCCSFVRNPRPVLARLRRFVGVPSVALMPRAVLSHLLLGRFATPALHSALARSLAQISPATLRARLRAVLAVDVAAKLEQVTVPVLVLRAARDRVVPRAASQLVSQLRPMARVVQLDAPHLLLQAVPSEAARVVGSFLREVANAERGP